MRVVAFLAFQAAWWGTALLAREHHPSLAALPSLAFVAFTAALAQQRMAVIVLSSIAALLGLAVDNTLAAFDAIAFDAGFLPALWAAFACTFTSSLDWLKPRLALVVGAVGGPLEYRGAHALGAIHVSSLFPIAIAWAIATPLLAFSASRFAQPSWARRARTIPRLLAIALLAVALSPILFALAFAVDLVRRSFVSVRVLAFGLVYAVGEVVGLVLLLFAGTSLKNNYAIQLWWTGVLFRAVCALFRLRVVVDGDECVSPGCVYLVRHASIIDTLLPSVLVSRAHGVKLRFVVKRELLEDPCLDIAGLRLPNHFVERGAGDLDAIRALAETVAADEGLLIYPEGTRFTHSKRARAIASLPPDLAEAATKMTHVLPPKPAGVGALLDGKPTADAIFVAHSGLEGFAHVKDIWSGALIGRTVRVRFWRVARSDIPDDDRTAWLYREWAKVDAWVGES